MKTLYVTDLDGTFMRDDKIISNESVAILNRLLSQGILLTYATARSLSSASRITENISFNLPVIIRNGTILANPQSKKEIEISMFGEELQHIRQALADTTIPGFATAYLGSNEVRLCLAGRMNEGFQAYLQNHSTDRHKSPTPTSSGGLPMAPQGAFDTCSPKRRVPQALLLATAKKRLLHYLLSLTLLTALQYTS